MAGFAGFQRNGVYEWWWSAIVLVSALSVALVAPTNGLCDPDAHDVVVVHPIFRHQHDPHAAHRLAGTLDGLLDQVSTHVTPIVTAAGPHHAGLAVALQGMVLIVATAAVAVVTLWAVAPLPMPPPAPVWGVVPTGPPRLGRLG